MEGFEDTLQRLIEHRVEFVVIGGYAAVIHGAIDVTKDLDICCRFSEENLLRLQEALDPLHPKFRMVLQDRPLDLRTKTQVPWRNLYLDTDNGVLDCLGEVLAVGDFDAVHAGSELVETSFGNFRVLDVPTLLRAKEAVGRPHDLRTAVQLRCVLDARRQNTDNSPPTP
jgi:hypothetical protein